MSRTQEKKARRLAKRKQQSTSHGQFVPALFGQLMTRASVFHPAINPKQPQAVEAPTTSGDQE